ncbi:FAD-dependent oxidoreductase [Paracoccus sp. 1_MG-2023]|uniref:NAD(P)/FAD-dependent oxidoreductase n=1 Tax=unclassified Paracoccus (in: a-proteobacteria) TaxID=2688777 RepID=UPI001C09B412|nr:MULTISPECIES: FAD-dependent oxidoreductase [unclassified Paracoccus (in: a-proteobacteria)]MBU2957780.1 NAD(P)-binding protein [Paracoccus sp. C2R09]MDO6667372.1 FAD-dependent oxidoreductase [Paracoccus sp. 1_MG-2023]
MEGLDVSVEDIAIVGAGITGITCARALSGRGMRIRLFDKGRFIGGRLASCCTGDNMHFDHGAQGIQCSTPEFRAFLEKAGAKLAHWSIGPGDEWCIGTPTMVDLSRALASGLDVLQGVTIERLQRDDGLWHLFAGNDMFRARQLVLAIPAPQAARLLGPDHALHDRLSAVRFNACATLMAGIDAPPPFTTRLGRGAVAWVANDGAKPGRQGQRLTTWVAQADPVFSARHVDTPLDELARIMAPELLRVVGAPEEALQHAVAHRWRYSQVSVPLGAPFVADAATSVIVGGDWTLGPYAEDGWASGREMAGHLLARGVDER